jgi:hypothetical protein
LIVKFKSNFSKNAAQIVASLVAVAACGSLYFSLYGGFDPPVKDATAYEESGRLLAQEALARLESGGQITVITRDTSTFKNPASDIQFASFRNAVNHAHVALGEIRKLQVDPLRPIAVPSSDIAEAIRNTPLGGVIVSFMGPPELTAGDRALIGQDRPAIVAFCSGNLPKLSDLRSLFQQGLLQAAVLDRCVSVPPASDSPILPNRSAQSFVTLTLTNLPDALAWQERAHK